MMMVIMGHEYERGRYDVESMGVQRRKGKDTEGQKMTEICYMYMLKNSK
jgi:hypothetical protein